MQDQVAREMLLAAAIVFIFVAIVAAVLVNMNEGYPLNPTGRQTFRRLARLAALVVAVAFAIIATTATLYAAMAVALSLLPAWALDEWDTSRYKTCPDCLESANRDAWVCRH